MTIIFQKKEELNKKLILFSIVLILLIIFLVWLIFFRKETGIPVGILPVEIEIPTEAQPPKDLLEDPIFKRLELFFEIKSLEQEPGRENPFIPF